MGNIKVSNHTEDNKSFRHKISGLLEDMWQKIGLHHHSVNGDAIVKVVEDETDQELDKQDSFMYQVQMPGMNADEIAVEVENGSLVVTGIHREHQKTESEFYLSTSQTIRHYEQSWVLPQDADAKAIDATFKDGMLTITVPRK